MDISIIIPSYNEEKRIGKTLQRVADYMSGTSYTYEVIIIDNGNIDTTSQVAESFSPAIQNLEIVPARSHGKGWAIKEGMLRARGEYRLYTDADNSTDISHLEELMAAIEAGADIAIGSRKIEGAVIKNPQPLRRQITSTAFARLVRSIVPLGFRDTQNGFKLFTRKAAMQIFPHQMIFYWAFDVEVLALALEFNLKVKEVPIVWVDDRESKMSMEGMVRMLFEVIFIRINLWINHYQKNERRQVERRKFTRDGNSDRRKN
ncbi:MAG: dolichyl-phosphate beta-glucosyltransferase [Patescibacteria group bacterium]